MSVMKKIIIGLISLLAIIAIAGYLFLNRLTDIRTEEVKTKLDKELGLKVLNEMAEAHGLKYLDSIETYSFTMKKESFSALANMNSPFPADNPSIRMDVLPKTFTSRLIFLSGEWKDKVWGIQSWRTYEGTVGTDFQFNEENNKRREYLLPTYQYFIEVPQRIFEADIISHAGERTLEGKKYDLVYATWNKPEPQKEVDQYMLWIDKSTKILRKLHYTVRDRFNFLNATKNYDSYERHHQLLFPVKTSTNVGAPGTTDEIARTTAYSNILINDVPKSALMLDATLGTRGKITE